MKHAEVLEDWKYLFEHYEPAHDMTGGYVDQHDLDELLKTPTKRVAAKILCRQIYYWFTVGPSSIPDDYNVCRAKLAELIETDPRVAELKEKYHC